MGKEIGVEGGFFKDLQVPLVCTSNVCSLCCFYVIPCSLGFIMSWLLFKQSQSDWG